MLRIIKRGIENKTANIVLLLYKLWQACIHSMCVVLIPPLEEGFNRANKSVEDGNKIITGFSLEEKARMFGILERRKKDDQGREIYEVYTIIRGLEKLQSLKKNTGFIGH